MALAVSTEDGRVNQYAKHVFNCLKPRDMLYLTHSLFQGLSALRSQRAGSVVSLSEHTHENIIVND